jgi:hypothetical protein
VLYWTSRSIVIDHFTTSLRFVFRVSQQVYAVHRTRIISSAFMVTFISESDVKIYASILVLWPDQPRLYYVLA